MNEEKLGLMVWSPLAGGLLSGKYGPGAPCNGEGRRASFDFPPVDKDKAWACVAVMREMAEKHGSNVATVALAYVLAKPFWAETREAVRANCSAQFRYGSTCDMAGQRSRVRCHSDSGPKLAAPVSRKSAKCRPSTSYSSA